MEQLGKSDRGLNARPRKGSQRVYRPDRRLCSSGEKGTLKLWINALEFDLDVSSVDDVIIRVACIQVGIFAPKLESEPGKL